MLRKHTLLSALAAFSVLSVASAAHAQEPDPTNEEQPSAAAQAAPNDDQPHRKGFTLELGLGVSYMKADNDPRNDGQLGLAPLELGIGGFVNRDVALTFRATGGSVVHDDPVRGTTQQVLGYYGPAVQYYVSDHLFLGGGIGLGVYGVNPLLAKRGDPTPDVGVAFDGRLGWAFLSTKHHQLALMTELIPGHVGDRDVFTGTLALGYQYF